MSRYFLKRVTIEGFRGINNDAQPLALVFDENVVNSIYAHNGGGKSSIFEAIEYAITGKVSKLAGLPATERADTYFTNRFHSAHRARISLEFSTDDGAPSVEIVVERDPTGMRRVSSPTGPGDPEAFLRSLDHELLLLDYAKFGRFIAETPLNRGRSFASLLGLGRLSELRQTFEAISDTRSLIGDLSITLINTEMEQVVTEGKGVRARLGAAAEALLGKAVEDPVDNDSIAAAVVEALERVQLIGPLVRGKTLETIDFENLEAAISSAEGGTDRTALALALTQITTMQELAGTQGEEDEINQLRTLVSNRENALSGTHGNAFQTLLTAASTFLESGQWGDPQLCPVCGSRCEQTIEHILRTHAVTYAAVRAAETAIKGAKDGASWARRLGKLEGAPLIEVNADARVYPNINASFSTGQFSQSTLTLAVERLEHAESVRKAQLETLTARRDELLGRLPPSLVALTQQIQHAKTVRDTLRERSNLARRFARLRAQKTQRERWKTFVEYAARCVARLETDLSAIKTQRIEAKCVEVFGAIMQNVAIVPALRKGTGGDELFLKLAQFYSEQDVAATPLLSESFRNALAIAVYLSAILDSAPAARFVVLDDITSSFDAGNQFALMEAIRTVVGRPNNPNGPQVIILSHDGLLEKYFDRTGAEAGWRHQRLQGASPQGVLFTQGQASDRLKQRATQLLNAGQVQEGQPLVRQYLEYMLQQIIRHCSIPVPIDFVIKDNNRVVSQSLNAIMAAVTLHAAAGDLILSQTAQTDLQRVHVPAIVGNWVNHYETSSSAGIAPNVLIAVLQSIDAFADCFKYSCTCDAQQPRRRWFKSLTQKSCAC
jgi:hypothetical protein